MIAQVQHYIVSCDIRGCTAYAMDDRGLLPNHFGSIESAHYYLTEHVAEGNRWKFWTRFNQYETRQIQVAVCPDCLAEGRGLNSLRRVTDSKYLAAV